MQVLHILDSRAYVRHVSAAPPSGASWAATPPELDAVVASCLGMYVRRGCLTLCENCHSCHFARLRTRHFAVDDLPEIEAVAECSSCQSEYVVPRVDSHPAPLLYLTPDVLKAIQCLWLDVGYFRPHAQGVQRHKKLSQLQWPTATVMSRIASLPCAAARERAKLAVEFLLRHCRAYQHWHKACRAAVREGKGGQRLSAWSLLEVGVEAAIWPDLYHTDEMLDTRWAGREQQHMSVKRSFLVKVQSGVLDYGHEFAVVQYHYDRSLLARFCGRDRFAPVPLRWALADVPEAGVYFKEQRAALLDLHRQYGPATIFATLAPGMYTFPEDDVSAAARAMLQEPLAAAHALRYLHMLHALQEIVRGYLFGTKETLRGACPVTPLGTGLRPSMVIAWVARLEFQDGSKAGRQVYHGTGLPHVHIIAWLRPDVLCPISRWLRHDLGDTEELQAAVLRQQKSHKASPVVPEAHWRENGTFCPAHPAEAAAHKVRPYLSPVALAYLGHQDWQSVEGSEHVQDYMTKISGYVTKNSDSLSPQWLENASSGFRAGCYLLNNTQPSLCAMLQSLQNKNVVSMSCATKRVLIKRVEEVGDDPIYAAYFARSAEQESMHFLAWARATHTGLKPPQTYRVRKVRALAAHFASVAADDFYGQWVTANIPARSQEDWAHGECNRVPQKHRQFMLARRLAPHVWDNDAATQAVLSAEGVHGPYLRNILCLVRSWRDVTNYYVVRPHLPLPAADAEAAPLHPTQQRFVDRVMCASEEVAQGSTGQAFLLDGPAGSGKTRVLQGILAESLGRDWPCALTTPTGALTDALRKEIGQAQVRVDTVAGLFHMASARGLLLPYRVVLVDEVFFLDVEQFDTIMHVWHQHGCAFTLVFAGDRHQLDPPSGLPRCDTSRAWSTLQKTVLQTQFRAQNHLWNELLKNLRLQPPSRSELGLLCGNRVLAEWWPTREQLARHLAEFPDTVFLCVRRADVDRLNEEIAAAILPPQSSIGSVLCVTDRTRSWVTLHRDQKMMITHNVSKAQSLVNGAMGRVIARRHSSILLQSVTDSTEIMCVPWCRVQQKHGKHSTGFPLVTAYAITIAKVQGRTLPHVTILPTCPKCKAGYVAVSRVANANRVWWVCPPWRGFFLQ